MASPTTTVIFVRHGQTPTTGKVLPGRAPGLALSDKGREQAAAVAARLTGTPRVAAVYASPLQRTRETAAPIATALAQRVRSDRNLLECDFGDWTGAALAKLNKKAEWKRIQRHPSGFRFPNGESFGEMAERMRAAIERYRREHPDMVVVAVSHADPIKAAVADALGVHLDLFQRIDVGPCSTTTITYGDTGCFVHNVNRPAQD